MDIKELVNRGIDDLSPYEPGKPIEDLERELGIGEMAQKPILLGTKMMVW